MGNLKTIAAIAGGLALGVASVPAAQASVYSVFTNATLSSTPVVANLAGVGALSFTSASTGYGPGAAVATSGNALVNTFLGSIADYQIGTTFDGTASFGAFSSPTAIQYSAADDFIGFSYIGSDGVHYGYAEVFGPTLVGYAVQTVAGASLTSTNVTASTVPEPASVALLLAGVTGVGMIRRRKNQSLPA